MEKEELVHPHPHPMILCDLSNLYCMMCLSTPNSSRMGYRCLVCSEITFHMESLESLLELKHPYHPSHTLLLRPLSLDSGEASETCSYCRENLQRGWVYHCPMCHFIMHLHYVQVIPVVKVDQPKSHEHKLFLLPKPRPFTCYACSLMLESSSLPYGAYSCSRGCHYVVHSKCATKKDVWDGKDLYGEPEEPEGVEAPFMVIDGIAILRHFSHQHDLGLKEDDGTGFDGSEHCGACACSIRIHSGNIYRCTLSDCNFVLHETCANLPREIWYMLHPHRLKLHVSKACHKMCDVCLEGCSGFTYACCEKSCHFKVDVNCALISEQFIHNDHLHPLFSTLRPSGRNPC